MCGHGQGSTDNAPAPTPAPTPLVPPFSIPLADIFVEAEAAAEATGCDAFVDEQWSAISRDPLRVLLKHLEACVGGRTRCVFAEEAAWRAAVAARGGDQEDGRLSGFVARWAHAHGVAAAAWLTEKSGRNVAIYGQMLKVLAARGGEDNQPSSDDDDGREEDEDDSGRSSSEEESEGQSESESEEESEEEAPRKKPKAGKRSGGGGEDNLEWDVEAKAAARKAKAQAKAKAKGPRPPKATQEAWVDPKDIPVSPGGMLDTDDAVGGGAAGGGGARGGAGGSDGGGEGAQLVKMKERIGKMLSLGLHAATPEAEAQQAMKQAQRLLQKYNLDQATVLQERDGKLANAGAMQGGMVPVVLRMVKTQKRAPLVDWTEQLATVVRLNFEVKFYTQASRWSPTRITFYGLKTNSQLAAYSFMLAFERIHVLHKAYTVAAGEFEEAQRWGETRLSKAAYTSNARRNYCDGMIAGLRTAVNRMVRQRADRRAEKLRKARARAERRSAAAAADPGQAYQSDGPSDDSDDDEPDDNTPAPEDYANLSELQAATKEAEKKVEALEQKEKAVHALVLHTEKVAETVLADAGVKLHKGRKRKKLSEHNYAAWKTGEEDAKDIDLDRRALKR